MSTGLANDAPALNRRRSLPDGGRIAIHAMSDGWKVRTARWAGRDGGPGSILFLTGRGDFLEKYAETFHDLVDAGWGVASFDWRGQGLSGRQGDDAMKGHSPGFANWLDDLDNLIAWYESVLPPPWYAVAHSMGGNLLLRHLAGENGEFRRIVLLAPMLGLRAKPLGAWVARPLAHLMVAMGRAGSYVFGGGSYQPGKAGSVRQRLLTTDPLRYADEGWWVEQTPALALGSATWGWIDAAFASIAALFMPSPDLRGTGEGRRVRPGLARVTTPMLILVAGDDGLVDNRGAEAAVSLLHDARIETIAPAGHELLREAAPTRARVLARVTGFLKTGA